VASSNQVKNPKSLAGLRIERRVSYTQACYMNMKPLYQPQVPQTEAVA
jgi:hypothetical protein